MKENRKIYIIGAIDDEAYEKFSRRLTLLERRNPRAPVEVELNSGGGEAYTALGFASRMRTSSCPIHVSAHGLIASAAVIILAYGDHRAMSNEAWLMVHEDSGEMVGNVTEIEKFAIQGRKMELQWAELLAKRSKGKCDSAGWAQLHSETTYMTAQECLDAGIIDEVL